MLGASQELHKNEVDIHHLIEKLADVDNDRYPIYDGIVDIEQYLKSKYKIMFILKEPYDQADGSGGRWHIRDIFSKGGYGKSSNTFYPLIYIAYGILNNFSLWNDMNYVQDAFDEMNGYLFKIAYINISKLPALKPPRTSFQDIIAAYKRDRATDSIILKQIDAYQPDIVIGFGIRDILYHDLALYQPEGKSYWKSEKHPNLIYIKTYHPNQTELLQQEFVDSIINSAKQYLTTDKFLEPLKPNTL